MTLERRDVALGWLSKADSDLAYARAEPLLPKNPDHLVYPVQYPYFSNPSVLSPCSHPFSAY